MRPAGMSSDEEDDDYFSMNLMSRRRDDGERDLKLRGHITENHSDGIRLMLENTSKCALFHKAAEEGDLVRMEELIENGVSVDDSKMQDWSPLMKACSMGRHEVVNFLLQKGANPNLHKELFTPLMACCIRNHIPETEKLECVRLLIRSGARINATDKYKSTALMMAAENGLADVVQELLNSPDIDINATDRDGVNALLHSVRGGNHVIVSKLVQAGIDPRVKSADGEYAAIQLAKMKNQLEILAILKGSVGEEVDDVTVISREAKLFRESFEKFLEVFRSQLPDEDGNGGFSHDVRDIFAGIGYEKLYDTSRIEIELPEFLAVRNFHKMKIKFEPIRRELRRAVHLYHLRPWSKDSLFPIRERKELCMDDYIGAISNVLKHLAIMYATLDYVKSRIPVWNGRNYPSFDKDITDLLISSYLEVQKTRKLLRNLSVIANKIKPIGEVEADYVGNRLGRECGKSWKSFCFHVALAGPTAVYLCWKLLRSH